MYVFRRSDLFLSVFPSCVSHCCGILICFIDAQGNIAISSTCLFKRGFCLPGKNPSVLLEFLKHLLCLLFSCAGVEQNQNPIPLLILYYQLLPTFLFL